MKFLLLAFTLSSLVSCASNPVIKPSTPLIVTEQNIEQLEPEPDIIGQLVQGTGYEITYPAKWELFLKHMGMDSVARSMPSSGDDVFLENVSVVFEATSTKDVKAYYQSNLPSMKSMLPKFTIISEKELEISNNAAIGLTYSHATQNIATKNRAIFIYRNGVGYVITTTSTPKSFDEYYDIFDQIIQSFKFK